MNELFQQLQDLAAKIQDAANSLNAEKQKSYDEGFAAGVASVGPANDKIYSQEELNQKISEEVQLLQGQIDLLNSKVAELEAVPAVDVEAVKAEAKAELKAELKAKYEAQQVAESLGETGFAAELV
jgi:hypothetical protein